MKELMKLTGGFGITDPPIQGARDILNTTIIEQPSSAPPDLHQGNEDEQMQVNGENASFVETIGNRTEPTKPADKSARK
jgi:hypothetical protein